MTDVDDEVSEDEGNGVELIEEQYNAGVENGHILAPFYYCYLRSSECIINRLFNQFVL